MKLTSTKALTLAIVAVASLILTTTTVNAALIGGVTIEDVSSELVQNFNRPAAFLVDGSGLTGNQHTSTPDGFMWLNTGTCCGGFPAVDPNGPGAAVVTFDLGANYDLNSMHVWNYNEVNLPARGANRVEILTASTDVAPVFVSQGFLNFAQAPGANTYTGQAHAMAANNARLVRFNILSSHGGDNAFVGLSEVQFDGAAATGGGADVPEPATATLAMLGLGGLMMRRKRTA